MILVFDLMAEIDWKSVKNVNQEGAHLEDDEGC